MDNRFELVLAESMAAFASWATIGADELPADPIDCIQVQLMRWQRANFGDVSPANKVDVHMVLGIVEEFGELFDARTLWGKSGKLDALGDICVYAGQLCIGNRMAAGPILNLAEQLCDEWANGNVPEVVPDPTAVAGRLAHATLKHDQKIRGYDADTKWQPALVERLATLIAWAKFDIILFMSERPPDALPEEPGSPNALSLGNLITRTYLDVGERVILKRNWQASRSDGNAPG